VPLQHLCDSVTLINATIIMMMMMIIIIILGDGSHPKGSRGADPIGGLVDEPFGNGCKTDILRRKNRKCIHVSLFS